MLFGHDFLSNKYTVRGKIFQEAHIFEIISVLQKY